MFAAILYWELRRVIRRSWFRNVRWAFAAILFVIFLWHAANFNDFAAAKSFGFGLNRLLTEAEAVRWALMITQFYTILLVSPILAVGPIAQEKKQRTLELLLTTQERPTDIVLGKWLAALAELMMLLAANLPLLIWMQSFLSYEWWTMALWFVCCSLGALPLTAWAILAAVLVRRQGLAIIAAYIGTFAMAACLPLLFRDAQLALWSHAVYDVAFWVRFAISMLGPTGIFLAIAILRLCAANEAIRHASGTLGSFWNRPPIGEQPIYWKQRYASDGALPRGLLIIPGWVRVIAFGAIAIGLACILPQTSFGIQAACFSVVLGFPVLAVVLSAGTVSAEREAGTWDSLRLCIGANEYVEETVRAVKARIRPYWLLLLHAIFALALQEFAAAIFVFVLWLLVGAAVQYSTIAGLTASVRSRTVWIAILRGLAHSALLVVMFGTVCLIGAWPVTAFLGCFWLTYSKVDDTVFLAAYVTIYVGLFQLVSWRLTKEQTMQTIEELVSNEGFDRVHY